MAESYLNTPFQVILWRTLCLEQVIICDISSQQTISGKDFTALILIFFLCTYSNKFTANQELKFISYNRRSYSVKPFHFSTKVPEQFIRIFQYPTLLPWTVF